MASHGLQLVGGAHVYGTSTSCEPTAAGQAALQASRASSVTQLFMGPTSKDECKPVSMDVRITPTPDDQFKFSSSESLDTEDPT